MPLGSYGEKNQGRELLPVSEDFLAVGLPQYQARMLVLGPHDHQRGI